MIDRGGPLPYQRRNWPTLFLALLLIGSPIAAYADVDLDVVTEQLRDEAVAARNGGTMPEHADFAERFDGEPSARQIVQALTRPQDDDPFLDAYIRWQLTSFDPEPRWNQREFMRLLRELPAMVPNPRGSERAMSLYQAAVEAGRMRPSDRARLRELTEELDELTERAEVLNRPAEEFRHWLRETVGDAGPRRYQLLMEHCAATIDASWSTQGIKMRMSFAFTRSAEHGTLSRSEQRTIAQQLQRLVGRESRFLNQITFLADGSVNVTYSNARVIQRDVDNWIERMTG